MMYVGIWGLAAGKNHVIWLLDVSEDIILWCDGVGFGQWYDSVTVDKKQVYALVTGVILGVGEDFSSKQLVAVCWDGVD